MAPPREGTTVSASCFSRSTFWIIPGPVPEVPFLLTSDNWDDLLKLNTFGPPPPLLVRWDGACNRQTERLIIARPSLLDAVAIAISNRD